MGCKRPGETRARALPPPRWRPPGEVIGAAIAPCRFTTSPSQAPAPTQQPPAAQPFKLAARQRCTPGLGTLWGRIATLLATRLHAAGGSGLGAAARLPVRVAAAAAVAARVRPLQSAWLVHPRTGGSWGAMKQPAKVAQKGNIASFFTRQPKPAAAAAEAGEGGAKAEAPAAASSPNENAAQAATGSAKPAPKRKPEVRWQAALGSRWGGVMSPAWLAGDSMACRRAGRQAWEQFLHPILCCAAHC